MPEFSNHFFHWRSTHKAHNVRAQWRLSFGVHCSDGLDGICRYPPILPTCSSDSFIFATPSRMLSMSGSRSVRGSAYSERAFFKSLFAKAFRTSFSCWCTLSIVWSYSSIITGSAVTIALSLLSASAHLPKSVCKNLESLNLILLTALSTFPQWVRVAEWLSGPR